MTIDKPHNPLPAGEPAQALLDLIEADRARQCASLLEQAAARADAVRRQAHADARARMREAFAEQRLRWHECISAAEARLATQRRLHRRQHTEALLQLARAQWPLALQALWRDPETRARWAARVLAMARDRLPAGPWRIVHAPEWTEAERRQATLGFADTGLQFEPDERIGAGLKVVTDGNLIDGTLAGLLAERADFEARLLHRLESAP